MSDEEAGLASLPLEDALGESTIDEAKMLAERKKIDAMIESIGTFDFDDIDFGDFSDEVQDALNELFPSDDPLDQPDFDPIAYLNEQFPDEASLSRADTFLANLDADIAKTNKEISDIIHTQATTSQRAHAEVKEAKQSVKQLYVKVKDIKSKAEESEAMVEEICKDIKQLDNAKTNLQTTITTLKRLHMLVTAVDQLEYMAERRQYREAGNLLHAVNELHEYFADYNRVPKIAELRASVDETKNALTDRVLEDFKYIRVLASDDRPGDEDEEDRPHSPVPGLHSITQLSDACVVVDALAPEIKEKIIQQFCDIQLNVYDAIFREGGGEDSLDTIERRYSWWNRMVRNYQEKYGDVFPRNWRVHHRMAVDFSNRTKVMIINILTRIDPPESADVTMLCKGLTKTLAFERDAAATFEVDAARRAVMGAYNVSDVSEMVMDDEGNMVDPNSSAGIKLKYKRLDEQAEREKHVATMEREEAERAAAGEDKDSLPTFRGLISQCFDAYMIAYVKQERKNMDNMLAAVVKEEGRPGEAVLSSSVNLFGYIKQSVKRCSGYSTGQTMYQVQKEYQEVLSQYSNVMIGKLPKPHSGSGTGASYRFGDGNAVLTMACLVINTAEYCSETVPQLGDMVREKIDDAFAEHVNFDAVEDCYYDAINVAVRVLSTGLEARLMTHLNSMAKMPWESWSDVGDQSPYVASIHQVCVDVIPQLRRLLSETYFRSFCDSFITTFLPNFTKSLFKCHRVSELGAQQLLLDAQSMKAIMMELRTLGVDEDDGQAAATTGLSKRTDAYSKVVMKEMGKAEGILKLVGTPTFRLAESISLLFPGATDQDLKGIMELKGIKKSEHQGIIDQYTSGEDYVPPAPTATPASGPAGGDGKKKKSDFWSFVSDTKKDMDRHVEKAKKVAAAAMKS